MYDARVCGWESLVVSCFSQDLIFYCYFIMTQVLKGE